MESKRERTKRIFVGSVPIGGGSPVSIQSMTNTVTADAASTLAQIVRLAGAGCEIVRVTLPDEKALQALPEILEKSPIPVIGDIHFDYRLAIGAIRHGIHAVRLNPGNIGGREKVKAVAEAAGNAGIPIRVGANSGSLPKGLLEEKMAKGLSREDAIAESLVESALEECRLLEEFGFTDMKVSLKASSVPVTVKASRFFSNVSDYPLHLGVTEAGTPYRGIIKSAVGIGSLLLDGIGDTLRVSLSAPPEEEIRAAERILEAAGLRRAEPEVVSCPTCGRTSYNLFSAVEKVESLLEKIKGEGGKITLRKIAVMGCEVNGPGEAADADIGIAGGNRKGSLLLFRKGEEPHLYPEEEAYKILEETILKNTLREKK